MRLNRDQTGPEGTLPTHGTARYESEGRKPESCRARPFNSSGFHRSAWVARNHGGGLDLDPGLGLDERRDLDHSHGREMPSHQLAVDLAHTLQVGKVLLTVGDKPGHADDLLGTGAGFGQHREGILQALAHLADEIVRPKRSGLFPADLTGDEY